MKLYISCDMEGTAGVCSWTQCDPNNTTEYPYYRRAMSLEVRAAIDGARDAGVKDVLVNDSHSAMRNLLWDELPDDVRVISGNRKPFSMTEGIDGSFDAAFFTGYHAAIGTGDATLDHTYTERAVYTVRVNGVRCSETLLNAAMLGLHGVPVVLITGDRTAVDEASAALPWLTTVAVKDAIGRYAVNSQSPTAARAAIRAGARAAIDNLGVAKPFTFEAPLTLDIDTTGTAAADFMELMPGFARTGGRSVRFICDDYPTLFRAFVAAFRLGGAASEPA